MTRLIYVLIIALLSSACASLSSPEQAKGIAADAPPSAPTNWQAGPAETPGPVKVGWIAAFGDPILSRLVSEAITNNRDLRAAAGAVEEARALARQAGAAIVPAIDVTGSAGRGGIVDFPSADNYSLGLQFGWEVDVWGRVRATKRAAAFGAYSAEADFLFAQYSIAAAVAQSYFVAIEAGLQRNVANKSLKALEETAKIVSAQREIGVATGLDVALARRDVANAKDAVLNAQVGQRLALRALSALIGRYPDAKLDLTDALPKPPAPPPTGTPSTLLERRPDIIAAERNVAAAFNSISAAKAARLPTISLVSSISGSSSELSDVLDPENVAWQLAGNLLGPLFDGGLRKAVVDEATAVQTQAINAYAQTVIAAFQEVENSLDQNQVLRARRDVLREAATEAARAFEISQIQYEEGAGTLLDVLTIQSTAFSADSALVSVEQALLTEWINLNLALGGNWQNTRANTIGADGGT
ncbi:MAG: efflux transporter outer membrane subunit [Pseudomonadota bacterium]